MWIAFLISVSVNICSAYVYDNDSNYVYIGTYGSGGYSTYLYLPSVDVQEYNPPHYQIAGNFITIGGKETISEDWLIHVVRYNWYTKETYSKNFQGIVVKEKIIDSGDAVIIEGVLMPFLERHTVLIFTDIDWRNIYAEDFFHCHYVTRSFFGKCLLGSFCFSYRT